ncbi:MAG: sulfur carrier protein ThiS [Planctomycetes bacterium]|nr:sulfur carrier protein ThiS [Planctomycetota bacterium]
MTIQLNGEARQLAADATVRVLVAQLRLPVERIAVEINQEILPRAEFDRALADGDKIEVVTFVGGG